MGLGLLAMWAFSLAWAHPVDDPPIDPAHRIERLLFGDKNIKPLHHTLAPWPPSTPQGLAPCRHPVGLSVQGPPAPPFPIPVGEQMQYRLDIGGIGAAEWSFHSVRLGQVKGQLAHDVRSHLAFDPLVAAWLPLRVEAVGLLPQQRFFASSSGLSIYLGEQQLHERWLAQGSKGQWQIHIRHPNRKRQPKWTLELPAGVIDPISAFYRLRFLPQQGAHCMLMAGSRRIWTVWLRAQGEEPLTTAVGLRSSIRYHVTMGTSGMSEVWHGDVWLANSTPRLPYKLTLATPLPVIAGLYRYVEGHAGTGGVESRP